MCRTYDNSVIIGFNGNIGKIFISRCCMKTTEGCFSSTLSIEELKNLISSGQLLSYLSDVRNFEPPAWDETVFIICDEKEKCSFYKTTVPLSRVEVCINHPCNANCTFCRNAQWRDLSVQVKEELIEVYFMLLDELSNSIETIRLTDCGEPFFFLERMKDFLKSAENSKLKKIQVTTNGSLVDDELISIIQNSKILYNIQFSLNGYSSSSYKRIMGIDAFSKVVRNIQKTQNAIGEENVRVSFVVDDVNDIEGIKNISSSFTRSIITYNWRKPELKELI